MYLIYSGNDKELNCKDFAEAEATFCKLVKTGCNLHIECDEDGKVLVRASKRKIIFTHPDIMRYKNPPVEETVEDDE